MVIHFPQAKDKGRGIDPAWSIPSRHPVGNTTHEYGELPGLFPACTEHRKDFASPSPPVPWQVLQPNRQPWPILPNRTDPVW